MTLSVLRCILLCVITAQGLSACGHTPAKPLIPYTGTSANFAEFVKQHNLDWQQPAEFGTLATEDGKGLRYARWSPTPEKAIKGIVVLFNGRTEYIEKHIYTYADLLDMQYEVWTLDWRGQGFSDRSLAEAGHIDTFDTYVKDAETFINNTVNISSRGQVPKILLAHSMGSAIAALYLQSNPDDFDKAVLASPMMGLATDNALLTRLFKHRASDRCTKLISTDCLWESNIRSTVDPCNFNQPVSLELFKHKWLANRYSHDLNKQRQQICLIEASRKNSLTPAQLGTGKPTAGWMIAAGNAMRKIYDNRDKLITPTLIVGGSEDRIVKNKSQIKFCNANPKNCCRVEIKNAYHEILNEVEPVRETFFEYFADFVSTSDEVSHWCNSSIKR